MSEPLTVTDSKGRKIEYLVLGPENMLDLIEAGGQAASNAAWLRYAMVVASARSIGEIPIPAPSKKVHILQTAAQLGNEGFVALAEALFGKDVSSETQSESAP